MFYLTENISCQKNISFSISNGKTYNIRIYKFLNFQNKSKSMKVRYKDYQKILNKTLRNETIKPMISMKKPVLIF